ncbi:hypothetical protein D3C71_1975660 [compost metagenome]
MGTQVLEGKIDRLAPEADGGLNSRKRSLSRTQLLRRLISDDQEPYIASAKAIVVQMKLAGFAGIFIPERLRSPALVNQCCEPLSGGNSVQNTTRSPARLADFAA